MAALTLPEQFGVAVDVFRGEAEAAALLGDLLHLFDGASPLLVAVTALGAPRTGFDVVRNGLPFMAEVALPEKLGVTGDIFC